MPEQLTAVEPHRRRGPGAAGVKWGEAVGSQSLGLGNEVIGEPGDMTRPAPGAVSFCANAAGWASCTRVSSRRIGPHAANAEEWS